MGLSSYCAFLNVKIAEFVFLRARQRGGAGSKCRHDLHFFGQNINGHAATPKAARVRFLATRAA